MFVLSCSRSPHLSSFHHNDIPYRFQCTAMLNAFAVRILSIKRSGKSEISCCCWWWRIPQKKKNLTNSLQFSTELIWYDNWWHVICTTKWNLTEYKINSVWPIKSAQVIDSRTTGIAIDDESISQGLRGDNDWHAKKCMRNSVGTIYLYLTTRTTKFWRWWAKHATADRTKIKTKFGTKIIANIIITVTITCVAAISFIFVTVVTVDIAFDT